MLDLIGLGLPLPGALPVWPLPVPLAENEGPSLVVPDLSFWPEMGYN